MAMVTDVLSLEDRMSSKIKFIGGSLKTLDTQLGGVKASTVAIGSILGQFAMKAIQFATSFVSSGMNYTAQMEMYTTEFEVMLGNTEAAFFKVEQLKEFAKKTPFSMADLAQSTKTLLAFNVSSNDSMGVLKMLGDVSLGNSQKLETLTRAYGKMHSSQKVNLEDLNMMIDSGFNPLLLVSEKTGESMSDLYKRVSQGGVAFGEITDAFRIATSEGGQFFNGMDKTSKTFTGQMSTLKDNVSSALGELFKPLTDLMKDRVLPKFNFQFEKMGDKIKTIADKIEKGLNIALDFLEENMNKIQLGLTALGMAAVGFGIVWGVSWAIANWPMLLIIGSIVTIIAILDSFGVTSGQVLQFVGGLFASLGASIWNTFLGILDFTLGVINYTTGMLTTFGNFLSNCFTNPVSSIIYLFQGMGDAVLGVIESIASAIDFVFGTNLANTVSGWRTGLKGLADFLVKETSKYTGENYQEYFQKKELTVEGLGLKRIDPNAAWQAGSEFGLSLNNDFTSLVDKVGQDARNVSDLLNQTNSLLDGKGSLKSAGDVEIDDENLKWLLDISTMRQAKSYNSAPITITVSTGDIHKEADEDRLIQKLTDEFVHAANTSLS